MRLFSGVSHCTKRLVWCLPILVSIAAVFPAQENTSGGGGNAQGGTDTCLRRGIPLTIWKGQENADLQASDLRVTVDGNTVPVLSLSRENFSPRIVLLVDTSGSMGGLSGSAWGKSLLAVGFALGSLPPHSPVALVTFNEMINITGFGDPEQVRQKLLSLKETKPHGRTALYDAIKTAIQLFGAAQFGDTIYIVTDGGDNRSAADLKVVARTLIQHGIRAIAVVVQSLPGEPQPPPSEREAAVDFIAFVKSTGGNWIKAPFTPDWSKSKEARQDRESIRSQIQSPYALELQLSVSPSKPVRLKIATSARGFEISYPQHIEPCSVTGAVALR